MQFIHYVGMAVLGWATVSASGAADAERAGSAWPAAPVPQAMAAGAAPASESAPEPGPGTGTGPRPEPLLLVANPVPLAIPDSVRTWMPLAAPATPDLAWAGGAPVAPERLDGARGGSDTVSNEARLQGLVGGNAAIDVSSGANIIGGGAFTNMAGLPIVIQNSGANVLIQNATIVNIQLR